MYNVYRDKKSNGCLGRGWPTPKKKNKVKGKGKKENSHIMINYKNVILSNHLQFLIDRTVVKI